MFRLAIGVVISLVLMSQGVYAESDLLKDDNLKRLAKNGVKKIVIPSFQVVFKTAEGGTSRSKKSFFSGNDPVAEANMVVSWPGVDKAMLQKVADEAYGEFARKLTDSGLEVVPLADVTGSEAYKKINGTSVPVEDGGRITVAPTGLSIYDPSAKMDPNGSLSMGIANTNSSGEAGVAKAVAGDMKGVGVARVVIVVAYGTFDKKASLSQDYLEKTAKASIAFKPLLTIQPKVESALTSLTILSNYQEIPMYKMPSAYIGGDTSSVFLSSELQSGTIVASLNETGLTTGEKAGEAAVGVLGALSNTKATYKKYEATIDATAYEQASKDMVGKFAEQVAARLKAAINK
jgi:hypothetical protein